MCSARAGTTRARRWRRYRRRCIVDQGEAGNDIAQLLRDAVIDVPHAGDSWSDFERVSKSRMLARELRSANVDGVSGVRDLAVGRWFELSGHREVNTHPQEERQFVVTTLHHRWGE
ncbi:contractile injection system protein, VgrG/Pvc8 family [Paraburkholderia dipogonis]|uniref:contractile injection system protein, VgrG/Pvc8 family n=1 Tax=Paraburkholderia dipogonis TaxID=1211383 RepID=UPI0038BC3623